LKKIFPFENGPRSGAILVESPFLIFDFVSCPNLVRKPLYLVVGFSGDVEY
jgi:hypothetical protein